ncbi:UDP-xylose and UDP-N-acetylglucosamine transporter-like protein [Globomyces pollinis-pini]|nr:UDP-xylose and UDP-N-acetylglucosamine transporter-like protein [Globomyces pollinis-pini]
MTFLFFKEMLFVLALIFGGCCSNVFTLEVMVRVVPSSGNLITFAQFLFVAVEASLHQIKFQKSWWPFRLRDRVVPLKDWIIMVILFWSVSVLNNYALGFRISMPLHIIFRSGSLLVSMIIGYTFFNRRFSTRQVIGVLLVTFGVVISTYASRKPTATHADTIPEDIPISEFIMGICLLTLALVISCFLGQFQQHSAKYGKEWREGVFYMHALCLPTFGLFYKDIMTQVNLFNQSELISIGELIKSFCSNSFMINVYEFFQLHLLNDIFFPILWVALFMNMITQYVCISGVSKLTSMASSVTVNLVLSVRKFMSLILSILLFKHQLTMGNIVGAILVIFGTIVYSIAPNAALPSTSEVEKKNK